MTVPRRTLWAILLALTLAGASCQLSIPGFGNVVFGPSEAQPTATPPTPPTDTPPAPPTPTDTPLPAITDTPTPALLTPTPTLTPTVEALQVTSTATLSLIEVTPETGWAVAPLLLALTAAGSGVLAILVGWLLRRPPT